MGYPKGSALELHDGTLNLRHCTEVFTMRLLPWSLPRVGDGGGKRQFILLVISRMLVVLWEKGSGLPGRHVQVLFLMTIRILGFQRRGDGKDCAPLPPKEWGVRWACLAIFFFALGLGNFCTWGRLEPAFGGNRRRGFGWSVQPKGSVHWH